MKIRHFIVGFTSVTVAFLALSGGTINAQDIDTGDGFMPKSMCPDSEAPISQPVLRRGHYGMNVEYVQYALGITQDGCFGPGTHQAVVDYQTCHGLYVDGIVGSQTWSALNSGKTLSGCPRNVSVATDEPVVSGTRSVEIDQWREVVRLKVDGNTIDTMPMIDNHYVLTKGSYTVCGFHRTNYDYTLSWKLPNFVRLCKSDGTITGKGFHAIPVSIRSGAVMHDDSYLGTGQKQSSGCIRLSLTDSQILWDFAKHGMSVVVI